MDLTKSATDGSNYARQRYIVDVGAVSPEEFGDSRVKEVHCRWLDHGDDAAVMILGRRFLHRFIRSPARYVLQVDARDDMSLTDVAHLSSREITSPDGRPFEQLIQITARSDKIAGHRVQLMAQAFNFSGRYGFITENDRPDYLASSPEQQARGAYFSHDDTMCMGDGSEPYKFI